MNTPQHSLNNSSSTAPTSALGQPHAAPGTRAISPAARGGIQRPHDAAHDLSTYLDTASRLDVPGDVSQDIAASPETSVSIADENAISIKEAVALAAGEGYPLAKTTLQRKAKEWREAGYAAPVKAIMMMTPAGALQRLDREDFLSWIIDMKNALRRGTMQVEAPRDSARPSEVGVPTHPSNAKVGEPAPTSDKYVAQLEREITGLRDQHTVLVGQLTIKDQQIAAQSRTMDTLLNRSQETNVLFQGLQGMMQSVLALGGAPRRPDTPEPPPAS